MQPEDAPQRRRGAEARATYRLQLRPAFGFGDAAAQVPYLAGLGVTHVYVSPISAAAAGSEHGYDVVDPARLNPELGGEEGFRRLLTAVERHGLGLLVDVVPNHMAADAVANPYWRDVLEDGLQSPFAGWFDIDWGTPDRELAGRVLLAILDGDLDGRIAAGDVRLVEDGRDLAVSASTVPLPLGLTTIAPLLGATAVRSGSEELAGIGAEAMLLDPVEPGDVQGAAVRRQARVGLRRRVAATLEAEPAAASALTEMVDEVNRDAARLRALVGAQCWVLDDWRNARLRLNYRRFFTVSSLAGVRVEDPAVRVATHERVLELVREGSVDGLRIDHIDGLRDPEDYLAWLATQTRQVWTVVEKILAPEERLPATWRCAGTTGYEFAALLVSLSVDPHGISLLEVLRDDVAGARPEFAQTLRAAKLELLDGELHAEMERALRALEAVAAHDPVLSEHSEVVRATALTELLAALPVYRTYVRRGRGADEADRAVISAAVSRAGGVAAVPRALLERLGAILAGEHRDEHEDAQILIDRVQQLSPALMAKGLEDTSLYRDVALLARNDVGGDPDRSPVGPSAYHHACLMAQSDHSRGLLATSTHDTKRSEDVRARLCVLSELAAPWAELVKGWHRRHAPMDPGGDAALVLYQTLLGAWPISVERAAAYMEKAMREAAERTRWTEPDAAYEGAVRRLVEGVIGDTQFVADLERFLGQLRPLAERLSLAWALLKLTSPGVPDIYQGCELWDLSLVDPDNRRPVDFGLRSSMLEEARAAPPGALLGRAADGLPKLAVTVRALDLRLRRPELFGPAGDYTPLRVDGPLAESAIAFARGGRPGAVTVVPRLVAASAGGWRGTAVDLPEGTWRDLFGGAEHRGGRLDLDSLLGDFPVALLERS